MIVAGSARCVRPGPGQRSFGNCALMSRRAHRTRGKGSTPQHAQNQATDAGVPAPRPAAPPGRRWSRGASGRRGCHLSVSATAAPDLATYCTILIEVTSNSGVSARTPASPGRRDFIGEIVAADVREGRVPEVVTRFPPEPNGYLHLGHSKAIALSFGIAEEFGGRCHLRFDDTNPVGEELEYIVSIQEDIRWLGFDWGEHLYFASDYFHQLYDWAVHLIKAGKAYVDDLSADKIREHRGTLTEPGKNSPWRDRPVDENLNLFERMRAGEFPDGARVLRAKIDMTSPNINMRDP